MTDKKRVSFPVYKIEHDDFTGRLRVSGSFVQMQESIVRHYQPGTNLVNADTMDGGLAGILTAPAGSHLGENEIGQTAVVLPCGTKLTPDEAVRAAKSGNRNQSYGLGWSPVKD